MSFISFLQTAAEGAGSASSTASLLTTIVPFALMIVIFYFLLIRPQNKKQKETQKMIDALQKGDKVVTIGGIHGVISSTKEKTVIVKVDDNTKIEFTRTAIASVESDKPAQKVKTERKGFFKFKKAEADKEVQDNSKVSEPESEK